MVHNILIAGRTDVVSAEQYNRVAAGLRSSARLAFAGENAVVTVIQDMDTVNDYISDGDISVLIITETLSSIAEGQEIAVSKNQLVGWSDQYPEMTVILLLNAQKKGGIKLKKLYDVGFFNVLYYDDFNVNELVELIQDGGRSKKEAYSYYGIRDGISDDVSEERIDKLPKKAKKVRREESYQESEKEERRPAAKPKKQFVYNPESEDDDNNDDYDGRVNYPTFGKKLPKQPEPVYDEDEDEDYEEAPRKSVPEKSQSDYEDEDYDYDEEEDNDEDYEEDDGLLVPPSAELNLCYGEVVKVRDDNTMIIRIPLADGVNVDKSFVGTKVYFAGRISS